MNPRVMDGAVIALAIAGFGLAGGMDMEDAIAAEQAAEPALHCRAPLNLRVALTADEAAGRCDLTQGAMK